METVVGAIMIDPEFRAIIPPISAEERAELERSLLAYGCRHALDVWGGHGILLDGHNRHEICTRLGIEYDVSEVELADRDAAKVWIIRNQFARRNLTPFTRAELALVLEPLLRAKAKENLSIGGAAGGKGCQNSDKAVIQPIDTKVELARAAHVSHDTIHKARVIAQKAPEPVKEALRKGETSINAVYTDIRRKEKEVAREQRREENRARVEVVDDPLAAGARFATIVMDPPWDWGDEGDQDQLGRARPTYATMGLAELLDLPVPNLSDNDCHLYMWITNRSLPKGFALLERWGFRYITMLTWPKPSFGMGNYFRGQTEHVLFGVKGSQPLTRKNASTLLPTWKRGPLGHSSKPVEFYEFIESCSPGPYLEMFARSNRDGWKSWGADA